jgi:hypothetical protein
MHYTPSAIVRSRGATISVYLYREVAERYISIGFNIGLTLFSDHTRVTADINGATATYLTGYTTNTWIHLASTVDSTGTVSVYVNGVLVATANGNPSCMYFTDGSIQMNWNDTGWRNLRLYTKALSAAEIASIAAGDAA